MNGERWAKMTEGPASDVRRKAREIVNKIPSAQLLPRADMSVVVDVVAADLARVADKVTLEADRLRQIEAQSAHRAEAVKDRRLRRQTSGRAITAPPPHAIDEWSDIGFPLKLALAMPWRCPACLSQIRHSDVESIPSHKTLYRCHVCRLELTLDNSGARLTVAPFDDEPPTPTRAFPSPNCLRTGGSFIVFHAGCPSSESATNQTDSPRAHRP